MSDVDDLIRRRAYELWEQGDKTPGSASETDFWLQAERDIKRGPDRTPPATPEQRLD
jgi:Protein of unknown function (DUF2934)